MFMYASRVTQAEALCAQYQPIQGWSSRRYGERKPSPVLRASMRGQISAAPAAMMTLLIPGLEARRSRCLQVRGGHAIAAVLRDGDYEDICVQSLDNAPFQLLEFGFHGEFFWIRTQNGVPVQLLAVNARLFRTSSEVVFESADGIPYVSAHFWENGIVIERAPEGTVHEGKVYVRDLRDRQFQRK
jgi:hypothetical protein